MVKIKEPKVGKFGGITYDWRKPNKPRFLSGIWNPHASFITPKWRGWGYEFNRYVNFSFV